MDLRLLLPIVAILLVMIPLAGLTFGLTLRLAVRPFVETIADALRDLQHPVETGQLQDQLATLEREVLTLRRALKADQDGKPM
jgi:hypothetical protein